MSYFAQSLIMGFFIAAPVGPIGLLCIQRTLSVSWKMGFVTGLGAATADLIYGLVGALGFTALIAILVDSKMWLSFIGGGILSYLGITTIQKATISENAEWTDQSHAKAYLTTFFLTLSNPMTIIAFIAIFSAIGKNASLGELSLLRVGVMCSGIFLGSVLWWLTLSSLSHYLRKKISSKITKSFNTIAGALILLVGAYQIYLGLKAMLY